MRRVAVIVTASGYAPLRPQRGRLRPRCGRLQRTRWDDALSHGLAIDLPLRDSVAMQMAFLTASGRWCGLALITVVAICAGRAAPEAALLFDREVINRYSLDHLPRSISIRQGDGRWFGYDLERAKVYKVWQAPAGKPGLITRGFVVRSDGPVLFEDKSEATWRLRREGREIPLQVRYLGSSQRGTGADTRFLLKWELRHDGGRLELMEEVLAASAGAPVAPTRLLRVNSLADGEALLLPGPAAAHWKIVEQRDGPGREKTALTGGHWHRVVLNPVAANPRR